MSASVTVNITLHSSDAKLEEGRVCKLNKKNKQGAVDVLGHMSRYKCTLANNLFAYVCLYQMKQLIQLKKKS